jgi:hypothetical protein
LMRSERIASAVGLVARGALHRASIPPFLLPKRGCRMNEKSANGAPARNRTPICRLQGGCIAVMLQGHGAGSVHRTPGRPLTRRPLCRLNQPTKMTMDGRSVAHRRSETEARGPSNSGRSRCQTASMPRGHRGHATRRAGARLEFDCLGSDLADLLVPPAGCGGGDGPAPVSLVLPRALVRAAVTWNPISSRAT